MVLRSIPLSFRMLGVHRAVPAEVQPARPHLATARRLTQAIGGPQLAWERLTEAGLVPPAWAATDRRVFRGITETALDAGSQGRGYAYANWDGGPPGSTTYFVTDRLWPFTVDEAVAIAAELTAVEEAEVHAFELCRRLKVWGSALPTPTRIAWRGLARDADIPRTPGHSDGDDLRTYAEAALEDAGHAVPSTDPGEVCWARACAFGLRVPDEIEDPYFLHGPHGAPRPPAALRGLPFADLPDPWQPLQEMERRHVRLDAIAADALVLLVLPP